MKELIKKTLENEFDESGFLAFAKNLFTELTINPQSLTVTGGFSQHIKQFKFLGEFKDAEKKRLDVLTVELVGNTKVARARSMQRNIVAKYLKDNLCDASLVAFYSKESSDWRLSFVNMEYKLTDKGANVEVGTPAKRYSFLVGKTEPSHTAETQLLPILKEQKVAPLVSVIEDAFSIEKVTKEFFIKYKQLFTSLEEQLEKNHTFKNEAIKNNIDTVDFAKKLLGQIVFLYFLQKKGWLGVPKGKTWGEGDTHFLRNLFNKCLDEGQNFFNDYLEFLFYDTLNNPRNDQADRNYSARFKCKIPFLNGGLFEPKYDWKNSFIYLNNNIFADIFDVFDLYNFTVKEDEPLEKEVAVDPEMLGKVFENLLEENLRKGKGTYYTPREIVHYMCQESLTNYIATETNINIEAVRTLIRHAADDSDELPDSIRKHSQDIDKALANIKVVDPACGSGAFCVGMLQEIIKARLLLNPALSEYRIKKETIQNCIYGVDIDPGAIEIAKLRLWLSLVVDYDLEDIEPLPNLDYKIMQGNSLLEELVIGSKTIRLFDSAAVGIKPANHDAQIEGANKSSLFDDFDATKKVFVEYHKWQLKLFNAKSIEKKKDIRERLRKIEMELIEKTVKSEMARLESVDKNIGKYVNTGVGLTEKDAAKKAEILNTQAKINEILDEIKTTGNRPYFLWHLYFGDVFLEKGGFDVVIANPPYVGFHGIDARSKKIFKNIFLSANGKYDLYTLFMEKGYYLLKDFGYFSYICPTAFAKRDYGKAIRNLILKNTSIVEFVDFEHSQIFSAALNYTGLFSFTKFKNENNIFSYRNNLNSLPINISQIDLSDDIWILTDTNAKKLIEKIRKDTYRLSEISSISEGIVTGLNDLYLLKKKEITSQGFETQHFYPSYRGKEIHKWLISENSEFVFYPYEKKENKTKCLDEKLLFENCPRYMNYLSENKSKIESRKYFIKSSKKWFELWNQRDLDYFTPRKILIPELSESNSFAIAEPDTFYGDTVCGIIINEEYSQSIQLNYLLGLLNSKLLEWFYKKTTVPKASGFFIYKVMFLKNLPIKIAESDVQLLISSIVDKILAITKDDDYLQNPAKQAQVHEYERQIDQMVYRLYGLTEEEIRVVEGDN